MNNQKSYYQLIPQKISESLPDIVALIKPEIKGFSLDSLKQIISILSIHVRKDNEAAPLKMDNIKKLVPQGDKYIKKLIEIDIIQRSEYFIPGNVSYKYSFSPDYQSKFISFQLNNPKLKRRIDKVNDSFKKKSKKVISRKSQQIKYLNKLTIDPEAFDYINSITEQNKFNCAFASAIRIENHDIFHTVDDTSGRFHSNLTNLDKGLRQFLRVNGEQLINIDIKNSQPFLSTILLTNPGKVSDMTKNNAFAMLLQTLKVSYNEDVKKYISLVISGQLYEHLMSIFCKEGLQLNRTETKRQMLRILFSRNRLPVETTNRKAREIFIKTFPTVHKKFAKIRGHEKGNHFQNFKRFAILLQSIEAFLMLDVILKRIYKDLPGTIAITIHDSIMTGVLTDNVYEVKKIMEEELQKYIGFTPKIVVEKQEKNRQINYLLLDERSKKEEKIKGEEYREGITKQYDATTSESNYYSVN